MAHEEQLEELRALMGEIIDVQSATGLLQWDQEVCMPPKGGPARGQQLATLAAVAHRMLTAPRVGKLLDALGGASGLDSDSAALVREFRHDHERAQRLPERLVREFAEARSQAYEAWVAARETSDFGRFEPHLERIVLLSREKAEYFGYSGSPYNALLEEYERGMTAEMLSVIFGELAPRLRGLVARIVPAAGPSAGAWLDRDWDEEIQWALTLRVLRDMGYDFDAGRQDRSVHPFTVNFDIQDVRVTTRINRRELFSGLTGSIHEGGHALYEQGFALEDRRTVLAQAPSLGIHESQSRMWENMIGRSRPFWEHYAPVFREHHGAALGDAGPEDFYRAINHVAPSFIRVEADECTYNLHIILRFEIELALIEGNLRVRDVPEAWNAKVKEYLGLTVPNDAAGCLQDIHWSHGGIGYFPTYALGNLYAAQLFETIQEALPDLWEQVAQGSFAPLLAWLRTHVHRTGRRKLAAAIVEDATGSAPSAAPFLRYIEGKYGALYGI